MTSSGVTIAGVNVTSVACAFDAVATGIVEIDLLRSRPGLPTSGGVARTARIEKSPTSEYVMTRALRIVNPSVSE